MAFVAVQSRWDTCRSTGRTVEPAESFPPEQHTCCLNHKEVVFLKRKKRYQNYSSLYSEMLQVCVFLATVRHY